MLKYLMYLTMLGGMAACSSAPSPTQEQLNAWAEFPLRAGGDRLPS